jgi:tetratricopeptide (TPR) repeat protein
MQLWQDPVEPRARDGRPLEGPDEEEPAEAPDVKALGQPQFPSSNEDAKGVRDQAPDGLPSLSLKDLNLDEPGQREKLLQQLYENLAKAKDVAEAHPISETIEQVWRSTGSPTIDLLLDHASTFVQKADLDMAAQVLDRVVELAPDDAQGWQQRAMVHFIQHDLSQALVDFKRALAIDPQHYAALDGLGNVLLEQGDKKGALEAYRKALAVNPFLDDAKRQVDELFHQLGGQGI